MNFKRGQAAMEYLMTYGWAILVIVIVLAALLYLGIFTPITPEVCMMPAGINCQKTYLSSANDNIDVTLVNGLQKSIAVMEMKCTQESAPTAFDEVKVDGTDLAVSMGQAFSPETALDCYDSTGAAATFDNGEQYSGKLYIRYYFKDEGSGSPRTIVGTITVKAQE